MNRLSILLNVNLIFKKWKQEKCVMMWVKTKDKNSNKDKEEIIKDN